jgi:hypothetical protein
MTKTNSKTKPPARTKIKRLGDGVTRTVLPNDLTVIAKEMHAVLYFQA